MARGGPLRPRAEHPRPFSQPTRTKTTLRPARASPALQILP